MERNYKAPIAYLSKQHKFFAVACTAVLLVTIVFIKGCNRTLDNTYQQEFSGTLQVGHLVGICMSPLFLAHAKGYFKDEGLNIELKWMPNPGDSTAALSSGAIQFSQHPFTNTYLAVEQGTPLKIIAGSGNGGLICIAQQGSGIKNLDDLKKKAGSGLKVGSQRVNTLELTWYRTIANLGLEYKDFNIIYFSDHFSMASAFQQKEVDVVTHVEPYASMLIDKYGGIPLSTSFDVWGKGSPDCVTNVKEDFLKQYPNTVRKYLRALLRADEFIKSHPDEAIEVLDAGKYYKVDKDTLKAAIPRQPPGVDLREGIKGMETAINDMVTLRYLKTKPTGVVDLRLLEEVIKEPR